MNTSLALLAGALLASPWVLAASSVDLAVTGAITPSACAPSISSGGVVDYGKISWHDLKPWQMTLLPKSTFRMAVSCEGSSLFALEALDNRLPSQSPSTFFVLGYINGSKWVGQYLLSVENVVTDDPTAIFMYSDDWGQDWHPYLPNWGWSARALIAMGKSSQGQLAPTPIKDLSMDLVVEPFLFGKDIVPGGETIPLDGSATFELRYL